MLKFTRKNYYNKCYKIYIKFKKLIKMNENTINILIYKIIKNLKTFLNKF